MRNFIAFVLVFLLILLSGCSTPNNSHVNEDSDNTSDIYENNENISPETSPEKPVEKENVDGNSDLNNWVNNLVPMEIFDTEKEYPSVIGEIFEIMVESESYSIADIKQIEVYGDENEFFVQYNYYEESLMIRVRKTDDGNFALVARGGGPLAYGLEKTNITLDDIK